MNVEPEPLSNRGGVATIANVQGATLRRSGRLKRPLDFSAIVGRKQNKKKKIGVDGNAKGEEDEPSGASVLEISFPLPEVGGDPFLISSENPAGRVLEELDELRSSESTVTAESDTEDPLSADHSYAISTSRKMLPLPPKNPPLVVVAPPDRIEQPAEQVQPLREPVDIGTLAVYRALIDHSYSSITPARLIEAIMMKHKYICSMDGIESYSSDVWLGHADSGPNFIDSLQVEIDPNSVSKLEPHQSHELNLTESTSDGWCSRTSPIKMKTKKIVKNPKFVKNTKTSDPPRKKLKKEVQPKGLRGDKRNVAVPRPRMKKNGGSKLAALASKFKAVIKKRKRRTNQTGWPTKKPQNPKPSEKPQFKKTLARLSRRRVKTIKVRPSRDASLSRSNRKDEHDDILENVVVSIEETVKRRRRTFKSSADPKKVTKGVETNVESNLKSQNQDRSEDESVRGIEAEEVGSESLASPRKEVQQIDVKSVEPGDEGVEPGSPKRRSKRLMKHSSPTTNSPKSRKGLTQREKVKVEDTTASEECNSSEAADTSKTDSLPQTVEGNDDPGSTKGQAAATRRSLRTQVQRSFASLFPSKRSSKTGRPEEGLLIAKKENLTSEGDQMSGSERGSYSSDRKTRQKNHNKNDDLKEAQKKGTVKFEKSKMPVIAMRSPQKSEKSNVLRKKEVPSRRVTRSHLTKKKK